MLAFYLYCIRLVIVYLTCYCIFIVLYCYLICIVSLYCDLQLRARSTVVLAAACVQHRSVVALAAAQFGETNALGAAIPASWDVGKKGSYNNNNNNNGRGQGGSE